MKGPFSKVPQLRLAKKSDSCRCCLVTYLSIPNSFRSVFFACVVRGCCKCVPSESPLVWVREPKVGALVLGMFASSHVGKTRQVKYHTHTLSNIGPSHQFLSPNFLASMEVRYIYDVCKHPLDVTCFMLLEYKRNPAKASSTLRDARVDLKVFV